MLNVKELMTRDPVTVTVDTSLKKVMALMKVEDHRQLPVLNQEQELVGIITDRDLRLAMKSPYVLHERKEDEHLLAANTASGIMTSNPATVTPDTPAYKAAEILSLHKFGALPVVEGKTVVGIISITDFLAQFIAEQVE